jgi:hypothetical protein
MTKNLKKEKGLIKGKYLKVLTANMVNKYDFSEKNIYLISSKASKYENEDYHQTVKE